MKGLHKNSTGFWEEGLPGLKPGNLSQKHLSLRARWEWLSAIFKRMVQIKLFFSESPPMLEV